MNDVHAIKLAQISDTHLVDSMDESLHGINPYQRLSKLIEYVNRKDYDLLILSGDLANSGSLNSYQQLCDLLKTVSIPMLIFAGNHDDASKLNQVFVKRAHCYVAPKEPITIKDWALLYVDTVVPGKAYGHISDESISHLKEQLQESNQKNIALFMHHHPFSTGIEEMDNYGIKNFDAIRNCFAPNVKLVSYGHVHHDLCYWDHGIAYIACPSASFQINETGEIDVALYGFKEYLLEGEKIRAKPIWFS